MCGSDEAIQGERKLHNKKHFLWQKKKTITLKPTHVDKCEKQHVCLRVQRPIFPCLHMLLKGKEDLKQST